MNIRGNADVWVQSPLTEQEILKSEMAAAWSACVLSVFACNVKEKCDKSREVGKCMVRYIVNKLKGEIHIGNLSTDDCKVFVNSSRTQHNHNWLRPSLPWLGAERL